MEEKMNASLKPEDVEHIAHLARIQLKPGDRERFTRELGQILDYINTLQNLDTEGIDPAFQTAPLLNVFREDIPRHSLTPDEALANAPLREENYFRMPRILS